MTNRLIHLQFETLGYNQTMRRAGMRESELKGAQSRLVQDEGERLKKLLVQEAPKKTGVFASGIWADFARGVMGQSSATMRLTGKHAWLLPIIIRGSRPHEIPTGGAAAQMAKGYPLSFWWDAGPRGPGMYHFWSVNHPGTQPNPFIERARDIWLPDALTSFAELGMVIRDAEYYR